MDFFTKLADNRIREAMEAGDFDDLTGKGQPLDLEEDSHIPPELRMAYKISEKRRLPAPGAGAAPGSGAAARPGGRHAG